MGEGARADGRGGEGQERHRVCGAGKEDARPRGLLSSLQSHVLALGLARVLGLQRVQQTGHVRLGDAERVVADVEGLLVDPEAVLAPIGPRSLDILAPDEGEEVGTESQRDPLSQVGVAEDAVDLHGVVALDDNPLSVLVGVDVLGPEHALPAVGLKELFLAVAVRSVCAELIGGHGRDAMTELLEALAIVDCTPRAEGHREGRTLALRELLQDGLLATGELEEDLHLQDVRVGSQEGLLLLLLLLLEELDQLTLARDCELGQDGILLEALKEHSVRGGERERQVGHRVGWKDEGKCTYDYRSFTFKFTHSESLWKTLGKTKKKVFFLFLVFFLFVLGGFLVFFFCFGVKGAS